MKTSVAWEFQLLFLEITHIALGFGVRAGERISQPLAQRLILTILLLIRLLVCFLRVRVGTGG